MSDKQTVMIIEAELDDLKNRLKQFEKWLAEEQPILAKSAIELATTKRIIEQYSSIVRSI